MWRVIASARCRRRAAQSERLFCSAEGRAAGGACGTPLQLGVRLRPSGFLLLWALLPRAARRHALRARYRFLSDSRALLRGEEAGWRRGGGGATAAGGRGRAGEGRERKTGARGVGGAAGPSAGQVRFPRRARGLRESGEGGAADPEPGSQVVPEEPSRRWVSSSRAGQNCSTPVSDSGVGREKENFRTSRRGQAWRFECAWHGSLFVH